MTFNPATKTFSGTPDTIGTFKIKVTASDTAKASASCTFTLQVIDIPSSVKQTFEENIQVYPNPTKNMINITFGSLQYKVAIVEITDISGKLISSDIYHSISNASVNLTCNSKGIYILNLNIDGEKLNKKICIE